MYIAYRLVGQWPKVCNLGARNLEDSPKRLLNENCTGKARLLRKVVFPVLFSFCAFPSVSNLYSVGKRRAMQPHPRQLEDISHIRDGMMRMGQTALLAVKVLDAKIDNEDLDGRSEATETRTILEQIQTLSLELSEELDAYQERYSGP